MIPTPAVAADIRDLVAAYDAGTLADPLVAFEQAIDHLRALTGAPTPQAEPEGPGLYAVSVDFTVHASSATEAEAIIASRFREGDPVEGLRGGITVSAVRDDHTTLVLADGDAR